MTEKEFDKAMSLLFEQKRYDEIPRLKKQYEDSFWLNEYPKKSKEEKVQYWTTYFNVQMRRSGEQGYEELSVFDGESFSYCLSKEPDFKELLPEVLKQMSLSKERIYPLFGLGI
ncbi:MAG: hypothetical protein AAFQ94_25385 [Bacteroidota bacterium]